MCVPSGLTELTEQTDREVCVSARAAVVATIDDASYKTPVRQMRVRFVLSPREELHTRASTHIHTLAQHKA